MEFKRGIDPKKAMGLGIFSKQKFESNQEAVYFVMDHIETITEHTLPQVAELYNSIRDKPWSHSIRDKPWSPEEWEFNEEIAGPIIKYCEDYIDTKFQLAGFGGAYRDISLEVGALTPSRLFKEIIKELMKIIKK